MGNAGLRSPIPAQVIRQPHASGRIALHGVNAAIGRAGADADHRQRLLAQPFDPLGRLDRLAGGRVGAQWPPSSLLCRVDLFVRNRALHHQHKWIELAFLGLVEGLEEVIAAFVGQHGIVQMYLGKSRNRSQ